MKLLIDNLDSTTGWSASGGSTSIYGLNDIGDYISGGNSKSLIFYFNGLNSYVEKTYSVDISDYEELVLHVWSQSKKSDGYYKESDFSYKIDLGVGKEYFIPVNKTFHHVVIDISSLSTIDRIRITSLHGDADYVLVSYALVAKDELPLDIFSAVKTEIESIRDELDPFLLGTVTSSIGDETIVLTNFDYIYDYSVIKITDGVNTEYHQIKNVKEFTYSLTDLYDGETITNNFSGASVYLFIPVEYEGRYQIEAIIPGITVWGFEPEQEKRTFDIQNVTDTWTSLGASERKEGVYFKHPLLLDCEARQYEILAYQTKIIRRFLGRKRLYINGRKFFIDFNGAPTLIEPTEHFDIIPKIQYPAILELREEMWQRTSLVKTTTITSTVTIK